MDAVWTVRLTGRAGSARAARAWVRDALDGLTTLDDVIAAPALISDAVMCVSELVNASLIAGSTTMLLELRWKDRSLHLSLHDDGHTPSDERDGLAHAQDLALRIVTAIAQGAGMESHAGGRDLWAQLTVDGTRTA